MNISASEKTVLLDKKIKHEGKSPSTAFYEIDNLKGFEYYLTLKNLTINTLKERLDKLHKENNELKDKLKLKKNLNFKERFTELQKSEDKKDKTVDFATTKDLQRILNIISEGKIGLSELTKICVLDVKVRDNAVKFLMTNKIIKSELDEDLRTIFLSLYN